MSIDNNILTEKKILSLLGLSMRSGNLVSGDDTTLREVKKERVHLVIIAEDASDNTKKLFKDKCSYRNIDFIEFSDKVKLGKAVGKSPRAVLGIKELGFATQIKNVLGKL